jgi:ribonucleoside-diphosphate reductase alpha chain
MVPKKIRKRDNAIVKFDSVKIKSAIENAAVEVLGSVRRARNIAADVTDIVVGDVSRLYKNKIPSIESIQDVVEMVLMREGYSHIAKIYILYREKRKELRDAKMLLEVKDDLKLPINSMEVLKRRYLLKDDKQNIVETPSELFRRVAFHVARAEKRFKSKITPYEAEEHFYKMMKNLEFMPNSPTLMNAGTPLGQLSACFVLPVGDSIQEIFQALRDMAKIHQSGGGTGFDFSDLRPKGDLVYSTKGLASGPVSFMEIFDEATGVIVQGGRRRGANMGILRCDHPDIMEFIKAKLEEGRFSNFNLSVGVTDKFMKAVSENNKFELIDPRTKRCVKKVSARIIFDHIVNIVWYTGDPGLIFLDEINRKNPVPELGRIQATNPCGELPLLPYESCNLASINLAKMVRNGSVNWWKLKEIIKWGIRFLDNVVEVNSYPLPQIKKNTLSNRKIGLGLMGFSDMLIKLGISYNSKRAPKFAAELMRFFHRESQAASVGLAKERGVFPNFKKSIYAKKNLRLRNATVNTIAPTGTVSIIGGCSSGIEPLFAVSFVRNILSGAKLLEVNSDFLKVVKKRGFYNKRLFARISKMGSLQDIKEVPKEVRDLFVTAFDVLPKQHLLIQAAFQKYTDNAVSKTINLPPQATVDDVRKIYMTAYRLGLKGITVYRYGSKKDQVLSFDPREGGSRTAWGDLISVNSEYSGGCVVGSCPF